MSVGDGGKERPEHGARRARELLHQAGLLRDAHQTQPQRHHADQADRQRYALRCAFERALADCLHVAADRAHDRRADQQQHEDEVHASHSTRASAVCKVSFP